MSISRREFIYICGACVGGSLILHCIIPRIRKFIKNYGYPYQQVGEVSELFIYPVESGRGRQVKSVYCDEIGGKCGELKDHQFVVIEETTKQTITYENNSRMVLIDCDVSDRILTLTTAENTPINVNINEVIDRNVLVNATCTSSGRTLIGLDCGLKVAQWLSGTLHIEKPLSLLYIHRGIPTQSEGCKCLFKLWSKSTDRENIDTGIYSMVSTNSIHELNERFDLDVDQQATTRHFRPNLVISESAAFDEDQWFEVKVNQVEFECHKPCKSCDIMMIDPSTGERELNEESRIILRKYRNAEYCEEGEGDATFGINLKILKKGMIAVGDKVYARFKNKNV